VRLRPSSMALSPLSDPTFVLYAAQLGDVDLLRIVLPKDPRAADGVRALRRRERQHCAGARIGAQQHRVRVRAARSFMSPSDKIDSRGRTLIGAALAQRPTPYALLAAIRRVALTSRWRAVGGNDACGDSARDRCGRARATARVAAARLRADWHSRRQSSPPSSPTMRSPTRPVTTVVTVTPPRSSVSPPPRAALGATSAVNSSAGVRRGRIDGGVV
jgi:hypothetical protein